MPTVRVVGQEAPPPAPTAGANSPTAADALGGTPAAGAAGPSGEEEGDESLEAILARTLA